MKYESNLSNGDKAFAITFSCSKMPKIVELTVGKVIIEHTDSPGRPDEEIFDNYKPQHKYVETYMCVETGIGSGTLYTYGKHIFKTREECKEAIINYLDDLVCAKEKYNVN